jgi:adenylyltransferase/sulfurtransferase
VIESIRRREEPFDRQRLIAGWKQPSIENARILLAGIGALGNACAADLVLSGVHHLAIVDFDVVATSNLSRTVLFRRGDEGRRKVEVGRERLIDLAPLPGARVEAIHADVVCGLGWGVYRRVDIVLGCVDSVEARAAVAAAAWACAVPAVVGGIYGFDGSVTIQGVRTGACVACTFGPEDWRERAARYSCDGVKRLAAAGAAVPATQVLAGLVGGLMANEALHILHGDATRANRRLHVEGRRPELHRIALSRRASCLHHRDIDDVIEDQSLSSRITAGALLEHVASRYGRHARIDLGRDFVRSAACKACGTRLSLNLPRHAMTERTLVCDVCWTAGRKATDPAALDVVTELSFKTPIDVFDLNLETLGIPPLHLLSVETGRGTHWIELSGDADRVFPSWPAFRRQESSSL